MKVQFYISLSLLIMLVSYGCGGSSEIEMMEAQNAMDQAKKFHANNLAPTDFQQAQQAWDRAQAAEKEGKTATAKVLFTSAKIFFDKSADISKSRKDALTRELDSMQVLISKNFDQMSSDLSNNILSPKQRDQVLAIASEVEEGKDSISELVIQEDLLKAVATAKEVQTKIYHAQLILAGKKIK